MDHSCLQEAVISAHEQQIKTVFKHIDEGDGWRRAILGIVFAIVLQVVAFAALWGRLTTKMEYVERDGERISNKVERLERQQFN